MRRRCTPLVALALLLLSLPVPVRAADGPRLKFWVWTAKDRRAIRKLEKRIETEEGVHRLEAEHWTVLSDVSPAFTAELGLFLDRFVEDFPKIFPLEGELTLPRRPTAIVYASERDYLRRCVPGSRGMFRYQIAAERWEAFHLYSFIQRPEERVFARFYFPVLLHEGTHLLVQGLAGRADVPVWFHEGMASYFQFWEPGKSVRLNRKNRYLHSDYWPVLKAIAREKKDDLPPLAYLTGLTTRTWNVDGMGPRTEMHYALAESFFDYLLTDRDGRRLVRTVFRRIREGERPVLSAEEIERHEPAWHRHILDVTRE